MATLSLCLIFKDEEAYLQGAIESVIELVDECLLVDSGSHDNSLRVIKELQQKYSKIKLKSNPWPHDFSVQKNYAIEEATSDWILFLDADERLSQQYHAMVKTAIEDKEVSAYLLPINNYTRNVFEIAYRPPPLHHRLPFGYYTTELHRLFRNDKKIRYQGSLHERIEPSLSRHQLKTKTLAATIDHLGPLKEEDLQLSQKRYSFYEKMAEQKVSQKPQDAQAHWELGVIYLKQHKLHHAELEFLRALQLGTNQTFETYYFLSLFQQSKWEILSTSTPQFSTNYFFVALAKAQRDPDKISEIDPFQKDFVQAALLQFELALRHQKKELAQKYKQIAKINFSKDGTLEWIEGGTLRSQNLLEKAVEKLSNAKKKGCKAALHEYILALTQNKQLQKALDEYHQLSQAERASLQPDTLKILAYSAKILGKDPKPFLEQAKNVASTS